MDGLLRAVDRLTGALGALARIAALVSVLICFVTLYMRYALGVTYIWLNESYIWANALAIALAAAYAYRDDALVRVDVFYERFSPRGRAIVDLVGTIFFLVPFLYAVIFYSVPFVLASYRMGEGSPHPSGMPALYLLKATILVLALFVAMQGIVSLLRSVAIVRSRSDGGPR